MNAKWLMVAHIALLLVLIIALMCSLMGPLALYFKITGAWLFVWALIFYLIYLASLSILPICALVLALITGRRRPLVRAGTILAIGNVVLCVLLASICLRIVHVGYLQATTEFKNRSPKSNAEEFSRATVVGKALPHMRMKSLDGAEVSPHDYVASGKVTVLVFWATYNQRWSGSIEEVSSTIREYGKRGIVVVAINEQESAKAVRSFITNQNVEMAILLDTDGRYFHACGLWGSVEQVLLVDSNGIVMEHIKSVAGSTSYVREAVAKRLPVESR